MEQDIYTADQVAEILNLHPKTVRRFIRQGNLNARKVGKQWRVMESDLKLFLGDRRIQTKEDNNLFLVNKEKKEEGRKKIQVSSVVDIYVNNKEESVRIANSIFAALNCKDPTYGETRCDHIYYEDERKARFILWGSIGFIQDLLACISKITE